MLVEGRCVASVVVVSVVGGFCPILVQEPGSAPVVGPSASESGIDALVRIGISAIRTMTVKIGSEGGSVERHGRVS